jgi:thymidylate kinase
MITIGFDGLVRAGKTTLIKRLAPIFDAVIVEEYGAYIKRSVVGFPKFPPPSYEYALTASKLFMGIERQRVSDLESTSPRGRLVLVDRTYLSCLAFDYAARHFSGFDTFSEVKILWSRQERIEPDLVFFMDVSHDHLEQRIAPHKDKFLPHFYDEKFNSYVTEFLKLRSLEDKQVIRINADQRPETIDEEVVEYINQLRNK